MTLNRRTFLNLALGVTGTATFGAFIPKVATASAARDPRFVTIILRGGLDGLAAVPPVGDPDFASLRGDLDLGTPVDLDGLFSLHPALPNLARQYRAGHAAILHACATPYRNRSHFDGQDVLESGFPVPGQTRSGWLNRLLGALTPEQRAMGSGLAVGVVPPLVMRGPNAVMGWAPTRKALKDEDLPPRILALYQDADPQLADVFETALLTGKLAGETVGQKSKASAMTAMAQGTARLLAHDDGPRIAALAFYGWDTHSGEAKRVTSLLADLDGALAAFETELGPKWRDTTILVATEFGRTADLNGTGGTDHGQATTAFLTGGAVKGGRVIADWPGLGPQQLYEGRDLKPTLDLRGVIKGVVSDIYAVSPDVLSTDVFPDSADIAPVRGLIA